MKRYTIGIEEEFQIVDPATGELRSSIKEMLERGREILGDSIKPEMHQSMVEVGTSVCQDIEQARQEVYRLRRGVARLAEEKGLKIMAASTHPFSHWLEQSITEHERYINLVQEVQVLARSLLVFGLHIHIGVEDRERAIHIMNAARYFLPHMLALSVNSPFWCGINTGLKSYRSKVFGKFPRTGIPDYFNSWGEYKSYLDLLVKTNCVDDGKKIWWDLRPHPYFETLEFRVCDIPTRPHETVALAALAQAIVAKLDNLIDSNLGFRLYRGALISENKWRAIRYGLDGKLIDFGKQKEVPTRDLIHELLEFVSEQMQALGSLKERDTILEIVENGTGADQQLAIFERTQDLKQVTDYLCKQTLSGLSTGVEKQQIENRKAATES
ncbi:MAG TPA: carboxylate-amine ligase [Acidobacteriota bacterium]|nr:carboxylate-amine ligase [Acidobacteriota bacterium]